MTPPSAAPSHPKSLYPRVGALLTAALLSLCGLSFAVADATPSSLPSPQITATPYVIPERLEVPVLSPSPSPEEFGRYLYYFHCMPCHGDRGQGLTDEWRQVWVEDHQNCWARGCHGGRTSDEGFPLPRGIPPVIGSPDALAGYPDPQTLLLYLQTTYPPQRPGALTPDEYRALAAYLLQANGRPSASAHSIALISLGLMGAVLLLAWFAASIRLPPRPEPGRRV